MELPHDFARKTNILYNFVARIKERKFSHGFRLHNKWIKEHDFNGFDVTRNHTEPLDQPLTNNNQLTDISKFVFHFLIVFH